MGSGPGDGDSRGEWLPPEVERIGRRGRFERPSRTPSPEESEYTVEVPEPPAARTPAPALPKQRLWLHLALFVATVVSTTVMVGPLYSACTMAILTAHEFGHYFAARYYRVPATLPFFIPAPFLFGTMGALIRMSPLIPNRRALFDIAAAGPIAGVVLAIPISYVGIKLSPVLPQAEAGPSTILLGDPLLFQLFQWMAHGSSSDDTVLLLNGIGFAGWVGLFVTALNLLPIGQLDGGHVAYAVFARRTVLVSRAVFAILFVVCILSGFQYLVFLALLYFMGIRHGPTMNDAVPLGRTRRRLALLLLVLFAACFTPVPVQIMS